MKIVELIPIQVRRMIPQSVRDVINREINHFGIVKRRRAFLTNKKKHIEDKYLKAINIEYANYCKMMQDRPVLKLLGEEQNDLLVLPRVVFSVTNKCSLRCRDCNNLIPYFQTKRDISVEKMINYIDKFFRYVDCCINVEVIGGEPFLYKDLGIVLKHLANMPQVYSIEVTTNGTIIPRNDMLEALKNDKVYISLSDYEVVNKAQKEKFITYMKEHAINYHVITMESSWIDSGGMEKRNRSRKNLEWQFHACASSMVCKTFWDGKLFVCGRAPALYELCDLTENNSYFDFENISDVDDIGMIKSRLKEFYLSEYAECCDYCDYATWPIKHIKGGVQL